MDTKNKRIDLTQLEWMISDYRKKAEEKTGRTLLDLDAIAMVPELIAELKRCYERIDFLEEIAEDYRQERPEEYCANCYAYLSEYDGDGVKECYCSDCDASE